MGTSFVSNLERKEPQELHSKGSDPCLSDSDSVGFRALRTPSLRGRPVVGALSVPRTPRPASSLVRKKEASVGPGSGVGGLLRGGTPWGWVGV